MEMICGYFICVSLDMFQTFNMAAGSYGVLSDVRLGIAGDDNKARDA